MKLTQIMNEGEEKRPLSNEVKKHFLEIVSTYNKYQESLDRKSDIQEIAETLGGITEAARTLAIHEGDDWFDKHTIKRNMSELEKLGKEFDKCAVEAKSLDQRLGGLYEDMGNILSRYYKMGDITEEQMKERLGMNESKSDCGCGCGGVTEGGCSTSVNESASKEAMGISALTGTRGSAVQDFIDKNRINSKKLFKALKSANLQGRMNFASALSGKPGNPNEKLTIKLFGEDVNTEEELTKFGESVEKLMEKNVPTDAGKWSYYKAQAKKKFDVYPSAYANGWAAKQYKAAGGGWKKGKSESVNEGKSFVVMFKVKKDINNRNVKQSTAVYSSEADAKKFLQSVEKDGGNGMITRSNVKGMKEAKFGYKDSTSSYINKHKDEYKVAEKLNKGNEVKFYDSLSQMEEKIGHPKFMIFLSNALRGYKVDMYKDPKIKNPQDAQEALYLLSK